MADDLSVDYHWNSDSILQVIVGASGPVRIDWGDGSVVETVAATSSNPHDYAKPGAYKVNVNGPTGLAQSFSVVAGKPLKMWDAIKVADNVQGPILDAVALAGTTSRLG